MATVYTPNRLQWKGDALHVDGKGRAIVRIVPDATYAGMRRVELPDGQLTDMANRMWAEDAALTIACRLLTQRAEAAAY
jgi:hypothetical protein